ncbi:mitosis initiation protein fs(1)Ya [Episyrphus balteatus]|uniref:mitosis initiation protein fs(1)Ya n=1 Tax=Episyrphus balteatus TaxID=286459 RepID=UPI0024861E48|nr:mitosis initiation protein fs(1)Ya [Episyrphus balteatus]
MIIPDEVVCKTCEKVFCCSECREKHEHKTHASVMQSVEPILYMFCPICEKKPLVLHDELMQPDLLSHIADKHLPLNCRKCSRLYTKIGDFLNFSKCMQNNISCNLEVAIVSSSSQLTEEPTQQPLKSFASSVSTQTSPFRVADINDSHLTPISMINLRWKAKSKITEEFISDSVSSIKNISSINNSSLRKSIGLGGGPLTKGKLVRSTSTPLQAEIFAKPKEQAFNISGGHMSSIHHSVSESEISPQLAPQVRPVEPLSRYQKPRARGKISAAVTPLRQVMSKSIQKAIAEHGIAAENRGFGYNRKKIFESIDSSNEMLEKSIENLPLDLRLSPAVRRTQSEIIDRQSQMEFLHSIGKAPLGMQILLSSTKKTERTESIVITSSSTAESVTENVKKTDNQSAATSSGGSVYQTCRSVEIITSTSTELSQVNIKENEVIYQNDALSVPPITPRIPTSRVLTNKKNIKFETPVVADKIVKSEKQSPDELFFTPSSTPIRTSKIKKNSLQDSNSHSQSRKFYSMEGHENDKIESSSDYTDVGLDDDDDDDEVFVEEKKPERSRSRLWNLVASVIRLPSLNGVAGQEDTRSKDETELYDNSTSIIRRCASFAGSFGRQKAVDEDEEGKAIKRKRTYTNDFNFSKGNHTDVDFACSDPKRFRIHGRMPIQRMRYY